MLIAHVRAPVKIKDSGGIVHDLIGVDTIEVKEDWVFCHIPTQYCAFSFFKPRWFVIGDIPNKKE